MRLHACVLALCTAVCASGTFAQRSEPVSPAPEGDPTFRSGVDLAQVEVVVTDASGEPVAGLTRGDFTLSENGTARAIVAFDAVDLPRHTRREVPDAVGRAESDVSANGAPPGRIYVFALDVVAACDALRARHFLREFLDRHFGPGDVASVVLVGPGLATDGQDFTSRRRLLLAAIDKYSGGFARACERRYTPPRPLSGGRSQQMASLRALAESLALVPGRKTVLLFTQSLEVDMLDVVDYTGGVLGLAGEDAHAMLRAATRGNVAIYPIDPAGLTADYTPLGTLDSFAALARATGGVSLINSNSLPQLFSRIVGESSTYYRLGFDSGYDRDNGRYVNVRVHVTAPGLRVRAREGYVAPSGGEARAERELRSDSAVAAALGTPLSSDGIPMRVAVAPFRASGKEADVDVVVEVDAGSLALGEQDGNPAGDLEIRFVVTTEREKSYPEFRYTMPLLFSSRADGPWTAEGTVRVVSTLKVPPGRHQLRVAAGTASRAGSVVHDLEVPEFRSRPYALAGMLLATNPAREIGTIRVHAPDDVRMRTSRCRPPFCRDGGAAASHQLVAWRPPAGSVTATRPHHATTAREFTTAETLRVFTEVYDNRRPAGREPLAALLVTTELLDTGGAPLRTIVQERAAADPPAHVIDLPLAGVADGAYVVRVTLASRSGADPTVERTIPIRVGDPESGSFAPRP